MATKWYHSHRGQSLGPYSEEQITSMILAKKLGPDDLVFREGSTKWQPLSEVGQFKEPLAKTKPEGGETATPAAAAASMWVALVKNAEGKRVQQGPFNTMTLQAKIANGEIRISDYVWRFGMKNWYRIISFPELAMGATTATPAQPTKKPPKLTAKEREEQTELLQNVMELKTEIMNLNDMPPPEVEGPDLVAAGSDPRDVSIPENLDNSNIELPFSAKLRAKATLEASGLVTKVLRDQRTYQILGVLIAMLFLAQYWRPITKRILARTQELTVSIKVPDIKKDLFPIERLDHMARGEQVIAEPRAVPLPVQVEKIEPKVVSKPPKSVRLVVRNGELQIVTDASSNFMSIVIFTSDPGEIIGSQSFHKVLQKADRNFRLSELTWPEGTYNVVVKVGDVEARTRAFIGKKTKDFPLRLRLFNKALTNTVMNERIEMIKVTKRLNDELKAAQGLISRGKDANWSKDFNPWRSKFRQIPTGSIKKITGKNRNNYFFANKWMDLQVTKKEADKFVDSLGTSAEWSQAVALSDLRRLQAKFQAEYEAAQNFSLWK